MPDVLTLFLPICSRFAALDAFSAVSGEIAQVPVVSIKSGHLFEKRLITKWLESHDTCPVTGETLELSDLLELRPGSRGSVDVNGRVPPRPAAASSVPAMLRLFQNEWDAVMLETHALRQQVSGLRGDLAQALYEQDAATRVIARLVSERDEARALLASYKAPSATPAASAGGDGSRAVPSTSAAADTSMITVTAPSPEVRQVIIDTSARLSAERKAASIVSPLAVTDVERLHETQKKSIHRATPPGVTCLSIHPTNPHVTATGGIDKTVLVYRLETGRAACTLAGHDAEITTVAFGSEGKTLFSGDNNGVVRTWAAGKTGLKYSSGVVIQPSSRDSGRVVRVCSHPSGEYWLTAYDSGEWSMRTLEGNVVTVGGASHASTSAALHPDGVLFGLGAGSVLDLFDLRSAQHVAALTHDEKESNINVTAFAENGWTCATADADGMVRLFDLRTQACFSSAVLPRAFNARSAAFDAATKYLAVSGSDVRVFEIRESQPLALAGTLDGHSEPVTDVAWAGLDRIVSVSLDRSLITWSL